MACCALFVSIGWHNAFAQAPAADTLHAPIGLHHEAGDTAVWGAKVRLDTACNCHPSLPIEIAASTVFAGTLGYLTCRSFFDGDPKIYTYFGLAWLVPIAYVVSLGPAGELSSGCQASWWHAAWIGTLSSAVCTGVYAAVYGNKHALDIHSWYWAEFAALGIAPSVIASLVFNLFLHPELKKSESPNSDQGMYLLPSVSWGKSAALNFGFRF